MPFTHKIFTKDNLILLKIKIILFFILAFFILLFIARLSTFLCASNYFNGIDSNIIVKSFIYGIRFDSHIIAIILCPFLILFILPYKDKNILKFFVFLFTVLFFSLSLFLTADIVFFSIFNNHIGIEILTSFTHIGLFIQMAFQTYWYITFPLILAFVLTLYYSNNYINRNYSNINNKSFYIHSIIVLVIMLPLIFFMLKGKFQIHGRNISIMDAQVLAQSKTIDLILNGPYTTITAIRKNHKRKLYFKDPFYNLNIITSQEQQTDINSPFERKRTHFNLANQNYNFILVIMESFDPVLIEKYPQVIPNFMTLKGNGAYYKNFFSSGLRSLIGITSTLFSVPYVWGIPTMKEGLGGKELSRLALYFKHKGYNTLNIITDIPSSDNAGLISQYCGFDKFYSKHDIPLKYKYPVFNKGFDYEGLEFLLSQINIANNKFFAYFYTSSLHNPYNILISEEYKLFPMDTEEHQFLNRAYYTDAALGNFIKKAKQEPWFKNTVFMFLPDHRAPLHNRQTTNNSTIDKFKSFLLIYGPGIPSSVNDIFATQEDILPTLIDLLNSEENYSSFGQSIFDQHRKQNKFIYEENKNTVHIIGPDIHQVFSEETLVDFDNLTTIEKDALQHNEAAYAALLNNVWKKK